jgi:epoxyqueuosine reductase
MEKPLAQAAGLGWIGKHTNLVSRSHGSWLFLASIFTTVELAPDVAETDHCGSCRACLSACPTDAFPAPYQIDARRCISYLTIENKGPIPHEFRAPWATGSMVAMIAWRACPLEQIRPGERNEAGRPRRSAIATACGFSRAWMMPDFAPFFSGSPIKRIGRNRFLRNVLIAAGNSGEADACARLRDLAAGCITTGARGLCLGIVAVDTSQHECANWPIGQPGFRTHAVRNGSGSPG